jgi:hypothetical protein
MIEFDIRSQVSLTAFRSPLFAPYFCWMQLHFDPLGEHVIDHLLCKLIARRRSIPEISIITDTDTNLQISISVKQ